MSAFSSNLSSDRVPAVLTVTDVPQLGSLPNDLLALNAAAAKEFLELSGALQSISGHIRNITSLSREATSLAAIEESERALGTLQHILADAEQLQTLGQTSREKLHNILSALENFREPLARLLKLPGKLNTIGMLSRIEGSRLESASVNVSGLTAEMGRLSENIAQQVATVAGESGRMAQLFTQSVQKMDDAEDLERHQSADLIAQTRSLLDSFQLRARASNAAALKIDEQYVGIRQAIDKIVTMLQTEDIARQRVEHVHEVLSSAAGSADAGAKPQELADILTLQSFQLLDTRDLVVNSLTSVLESLRSLRPRVEALREEVSALSLQTGEDGQSFATTIKDRMDALCAIFDQYFSSARAIVAIVHTVLPSLTDMGGAVEEVEDIQASIRLMALNAEIKTAHLGGEGAAMGVLASELHKITEQSDGDTRVILDCLSAMKEIVQTMAIHNSSSGASVTSSANEEVKEQVLGLVDAVLNSSQEMARRIAALQEVAATLGTEIQSACEVAERAASIGQGFDAVLGRLQRKIEQLGGTLSGKGAMRDRAPNLAAMYSMESEREVHEQFFGAPASENAGRERPSKKESATANDLGDNVELF
jgi:hypothetical protein